MNKNTNKIYEVEDACFNPEQVVAWQKTKQLSGCGPWSNIHLSTGHTMTIEDDGKAADFMKKVRKPTPMSEYTSADLAEKLKELD
jgi:hypothetical protein